MKRSPRVQLKTQDDEREKDRKNGKSITREMLERQWKTELVNSREDALLKRQLDLLTKQQRVVERSIEKEQQVLLKVLQKKRMHREWSASLEFPTSSRSLRTVRSMTDIHMPSTSKVPVPGMTRKTSHVHVRGLPPLPRSLQSIKSLSDLRAPHAYAVSLPSLLEGTEGDDSSLEIIELPGEKEVRGSPTTPTRRRKLAYQPVALCTAGAVASPLPTRHAFKAAQKAKTSLKTCHQQDSLPPLAAVN